ncbi:MAG TPA: alanine--tRNA ligase, partial [Bacillota bacterium]
MSAAEIRQRFLHFFERNDHRIVPSSSLVPRDDPTLLFTNAGMVQFKDVFTGKDTLPFRRATTAQKCVRAGGKHNDLENVGKTARHHTFFEMLGNFSFQDYFKRDAVRFAWEFLTVDLGLPRDRLWATIYRDDDEAHDLWVELTEIPPERIVRLGEKDNFWAMGDTGPCGPCSEIVIDRGPEHSCGRPDCALDTCGCDRWLELWNLVFMQYDRAGDGTLTPLPKPSIDTGMGLERIASVLQHVNSNFDTDLFRPIMEATEQLTGRRYDRGEAGFPFRVIADHARACTFLVADGVFPSNEFRGYVLRRILRRAVRFGRLLGLDRPFLHELAPVVGGIMGEAYPEVVQRVDYVTEVIRQEEERFHRTLNQGMTLLDELIERTRAEGRDTIAGDDAFMLYDTYGFPLDLTIDAAEERGLAVDRDGFERAMAEQRDRARRAREDDLDLAADSPLVAALEGVPPTEFVGYEHLAVQARVLAVIRGDDAQRLDAAGPGDGRIGLVLDRTPFYAEGGGQVADTGLLVAVPDQDGPAAGGRVSDLEFRVEDTRRFFGGRILHWGRVTRGRIRAGQPLRAAVDADRREDVMRNHTATHLLHRALKVVLGEHANQAGSLVAPDRLRFDFTHFDALAPEQLRRIEDLVNQQVLAGTDVRWYETSLREAREAGATALFGEKYGERVRVVRIGNFSMELCGGTHVSNTGHIGLFKIVSEGSVGSGLRRIEALTGRGALGYVRDLEDRLQDAAARLRATPAEVPQRVAEAIARQRELEREVERLRARQAGDAVDDLAAGARQVGDTKVVVARAPVAGADALRRLSDALRARLGSTLVVLGAVDDGKVQFVAAATPDLVRRGVHAGRLLGQVARAAGGGGGGRPDMAQAGGREPSKLDEALALAERL